VLRYPESFTLSHGKTADVLLLLLVQLLPTYNENKESEVVEALFLSCYNGLTPEHNLRRSKRNYAFVLLSGHLVQISTSVHVQNLTHMGAYNAECYHVYILQMDCMSPKKRRQKKYIATRRRCARIGSNHSHVKRRRIQFFTARNDGNSVQICRAFALSRTNEIWEPFAS